jgi:hypothetical protein
MEHGSKLLQSLRSAWNWYPVGSGQLIKYTLFPLICSIFVHEGSPSKASMLHNDPALALPNCSQASLIFSISLKVGQNL